VVKIWDGLMKRLAQTSPQDLISWMFPGAVYKGVLNTELPKDPVFADLMYTVMRKGQEVALHVEFQIEHDKNMGRRVWLYNALASDRTGLPVYSVVVYLASKGPPIVESPYTIELETGEIIHQFAFQNIQMWEIPPQVLFQQNLPGLLPLLPLTKAGNRREVVGQMIENLEQVGEKELLAVGFAIASLMFKEEPDQQWLQEIAMSMEYELEDTWFYKHIEQKGLTKGLEQGLQQGLQQELQALRATLLSFVETHFPDQLTQASQQVAFTTTPSQVQDLLQKLFVAHTNDEVKQILLSLPHA
jgi:predicted transposase YdaD